MVELELSSRHEGDWTILDVGGEIDMLTSPQLRDRIVGLIEAGRPRIVVDLQNVSFMDSTGLGTLVGCLKRAREHDGQIRVVASARPVVSLFSLTGLDRVFDVHPSLETALR